MKISILRGPSHALSRQKNEYVSKIVDPELELEEVDSGKVADVMTKIYIEFRMLNYILEKKKRKQDLTLEDIKTIHK